MAPHQHPTCLVCLQLASHSIFLRICRLFECDDSLGLLQPWIIIDPIYKIATVGSTISILIKTGGKDVFSRDSYRNFDHLSSWTSSERERESIDPLFLLLSQLSFFFPLFLLPPLFDRLVSYSLTTAVWRPQYTSKFTLCVLMDLFMMLNPLMNWVQIRPIRPAKFLFNFPAISLGNGELESGGKG